MIRLSTLLACLAASVLLYVAVFSVVQRPLTLGDLTQQLDFKLRYATQLASPKIVVLAGSNGRYSHRCETLSARLGQPCVNASIASGIGLDFLLDQYAAVIHRGDIVYMPLEYNQYAVSEREMHLGVQNAVLLRDRPDYLRSLPPRRIVETYAAFDLPFLIRGAAEMGLARLSFRRRTGVETLTPQGDEKDHTPQKAAAYAGFIATAPPPDTAVPESSYAQTVLKRFLADAKQKGISVVGGLPTVPDDTLLAGPDLARIQALFEGAGQRFVTTATQSRYPRTCFFDTTYHLNESCQEQHSIAVARALLAGTPTKEGR